MGDDLNVILETFKPAIAAQNTQLVRGAVPLQPPNRLEGRFKAAERGPGGLYQQGNDSMGSLAAGAVLSYGPGRNLQHSRESLDSNLSAQTTTSISMPRRVESIMGEEDRKKYSMAQANQRAAGGAYMTELPQANVFELSDTQLKKVDWKKSVESLDDQSTPQRASSYNGTASGNNSPDAAIPLETILGSGSLTTPQESVAGGRTLRNGRSPLARLSLIRIPSTDAGSIELQNQHYPYLSDDVSQSHTPIKEDLKFN